MRQRKHRALNIVGTNTRSANLDTRVKLFVAVTVEIDSASQVDDVSHIKILISDMSSRNRKPRKQRIITYVKENTTQITNVVGAINCFRQHVNGEFDVGTKIFKRELNFDRIAAEISPPFKGEDRRTENNRLHA